MWAKIQQTKRRRNRGFTIVELLIVMVLIGILAAIVVVAFSGVQQRAQNADRMHEGKSVMKLFAAYNALNSRYPDQPEGGYCPGLGYPAGHDGQPRCRDFTSPSGASGVSGWNFLESDNASLLTALRTVGTIPQKTKVPVTGTDGQQFVGPYIQFNNYNATPDIEQRQLYIFLQGQSESCPSDMEETSWSQTNTIGVTQCRYNF